MGAPGSWVTEESTCFPDYNNFNIGLKLRATQAGIFSDDDSLHSDARPLPFSRPLRKSVPIQNKQDADEQDAEQDTDKPGAGYRGGYQSVLYDWGPDNLKTASYSSSTSENKDRSTT